MKGSGACVTCRSRVPLKIRNVLLTAVALWLGVRVDIEQLRGLTVHRQEGARAHQNWASGASDMCIAAAYSDTGEKACRQWPPILRMCVCYRFLSAGGCLMGSEGELAGGDTLPGVGTGCAKKLIREGRSV